MKRKEQNADECGDEKRTKNRGNNGDLVSLVRRLTVAPMLVKWLDAVYVYTPSDLDIAKLCSEMDWDHVKEDAHLATQIARNMENDAYLMDDPHSLFHVPVHKTWRTEHPSHEEQLRMKTEPQGSPRWHIWRSESTGSSGDLAGDAGWCIYSSNVMIYEKDVGLRAVDPFTKFNYFCLVRGNYGESDVVRVVVVLMGCVEEKDQAGMLIHPEIPEAHSSPDRKMRYPDNVHHNRYCLNDKRRGMNEDKYPIYCVPTCSHVDPDRAGPCGLDCTTSAKDKRVLHAQGCANGARCTRLQKASSEHSRHKPSPHYVIQTQSQMDVGSRSVYWDSDAEWNDFAVFWKTNQLQPPQPIMEGNWIGPDSEDCKEYELVGEFFLTRIYYNKDFAKAVYWYLKRHISHVRKVLAQAAAASTPEEATRIKVAGTPKRLETPAFPHLIRMVPLKQAHFVRKPREKTVRCFRRDFWSVIPISVDLHDLETW